MLQPLCFLGGEGVGLALGNDVLPDKSLSPLEAAGMLRRIQAVGCANRYCSLLSEPGSASEAGKLLVHLCTGWGGPELPLGG